MKRITVREFKSPLGILLTGDFEGSLCLLDWKYRKMRDSIDRRIQNTLKAAYEEGFTPVLDETERQLNEYFTGSRREFSLPLLTAGTEFQKKVWLELMKIPYGETISYQELAERLHSPDAVRAVASANGANALSIIIPCHRVIGKQGSLGGYAGGLTAKRRLLDLEHPHPRQEELF